MRQIGLAYVVVTTVLFLFPPELPVTGSNMSKSCLKAPCFINRLYTVPCPL